MMSSHQVDLVANAIPGIECFFLHCIAIARRGQTLFDCSHVAVRRLSWISPSFLQTTQLPTSHSDVATPVGEPMLSK